jgi:hypothetical protein
MKMTCVLLCYTKESVYDDFIVLEYDRYLSTIRNYLLTVNDCYTDCIDTIMKQIDDLKHGETLEFVIEDDDGSSVFYTCFDIACATRKRNVKHLLKA